MAEIIDLCDSEDDLTHDRSSQSELEEFVPPKRQRVVIELDSEAGSSPAPLFEHPKEKQVVLKYTAHIPGKPSKGTYLQDISDNFEAFFGLFTDNLDDLLVEIDGLPVPWYGTPEMAFEDGPVDELEVEVRSHSAGSEPPEAEVKQVTVKINSPRGRWNVNVKTSLTIAKIASSVAQKYDVDISLIRAEFDGDKVDFADTIESLDIEDDDIIDFIWKT